MNGAKNVNIFSKIYTKEFKVSEILYIPFSPICAINLQPPLLLIKYRKLVANYIVDPIKLRYTNIL